MGLNTGDNSLILEQSPVGLENAKSLASAKISEVLNWSEIIKLANVQRGIQEIENKLGQKKGDDFENEMSVILREMLTQRSQFVEAMKKYGDVPTLMEGHEQERLWYKNSIAWIETKVRQDNGLEYESNPGWLGINTNPNYTGPNTSNFKLYTTLPIKNYGFIRDIFSLISEIQKLSQETGDKIQVKFPLSLSGFFANNDSIVIHFKKQENAGRIQEVLSQWLEKNNIQEEPREMNRVKIARDPSKGSFSELVAKNIAKWLSDQYGKYDNKVLGEQAAYHAVRQSQYVNM